MNKSQYDDDRYRIETSKDNYKRRVVRVTDIDTGAFIDCRIIPGFFDYELKFNGHEGKDDRITINPDDVYLIYQALKAMFE